METENNTTRTRILEAGAAEFAERGFAAATVRTICSRAQVNIAAINYHFGSKEELYREVLRHARRRAHERYPYRSPDSQASPEERLRAYVRSFLMRTNSEEGNLGWGTLVMREMVEPTSALDMMVDEGIRTLFGDLVEIVRDLLGSADENLASSCARSIISQCLFCLFSRSVISRMSPETSFDRDGLLKIGDEIVTFSLHALKGIASEAASKGSAHV